MAIRFHGSIDGHNILVDSDESWLVVDRLRLFIDGALADERTSTGGTTSLHATVEEHLWEIQVRAGAIVGSVKEVTVSTPHTTEPLALTQET